MESKINIRKPILKPIKFRLEGTMNEINKDTYSQVRTIKAVAKPMVNILVKAEKGGKFKRLRM